MPSVKVLKNIMKPELMQKIKASLEKIKLEKSELTKEELANTLQEKFWVQPDFDDIRISESPKLI
jgi:hypothetical protein